MQTNFWPLVAYVQKEEKKSRKDVSTNNYRGNTWKINVTAATIQLYKMTFLEVSDTGRGTQQGQHPDGIPSGAARRQKSSLHGQLQTLYGHCLPSNQEKESSFYLLPGKTLSTAHSQYGANAPHPCMLIFIWTMTWTIYHKKKGKTIPERTSVHKKTPTPEV